MKCPICQKEAMAEYTPFCSRGCKNIDLLRWLNDKYRIPVEDQEEKTTIDDNNND